jgi:DNA-binding NarL/FixJ family response regulator
VIEVGCFAPVFCPTALPSARRPDIAVLLLSGYTEDSAARRDAASGAKPFLQKPFTADTLAEKVREVLDGRTAG